MAQAQTDSLLCAGDSLHSAYMFEDAAGIFERALEDSLLISDTVLAASVRERLIQSENGANMSRFVQKPKVVSREKFPLEEFFLYYPLENRSWRALPNQLDADTSCRFVSASYVPDWNNRHYFSAKDENGVRSIYMTEQQDTVWTVPVKVEAISTSSANEIHPMVSPDGRTLYFASDGLYGAGGYDLYKSVWNDAEKCWSMPQNMGFPYSSPADDFLYVDSEEGRYSIFASNRECSADSVWVYVLEYEAYPVHAPVSDAEELRQICRLQPEVKEMPSKSDVSINDDMTGLYMEKMDRVRMLKDSLSAVSLSLDGLRENLAFSHDAEERFSLSEDILRLEASVPALQKALEVAKTDLQSVEFEFLRRGIYMTPEEDRQSVSDEVQETYRFRKQSLGEDLALNILQPEVRFDYSFRILDEALFAEDQTLPDGIVYQIQVIGGSRKASVGELKGLCPVYEYRSPGGMYIYRVGCFDSYDEALSKVHDVRRLGFEGAYLCAFDSGNEISVAKARMTQESDTGSLIMYEVHIIPDSGELEPAIVDAIVAKAIGKDLMRVEAPDGTQVFVVGPFDDKTRAEELADYVMESMDGTVSCLRIDLEK